MGEIERINSELTEQRKTVTEQGQILAVLASSIGEIKLYMKESIEIQREQAVLFEKFANHEEQNDGDHRHIHKRIDDMETDIKDIRSSITSTCAIVQPMAEKGARIHSGLIFVGKTIGTSLILAVLSILAWAIAKGALHTPIK